VEGDEILELLDGGEVDHSANVIGLIDKFNAVQKARR